MIVHGDHVTLEEGTGVLAKATVSQERLKIPKAIIMEEGKVTVVRNFMDIVEMINRDPLVPC